MENIKLISKNGLVTYYEETSVNMIMWVKNVEDCEKILANATTKEKSDKFPGFNLCVDGHLYFKTEVTEETKAETKPAPAQKKPVRKKVAKE